MTGRNQDAIKKTTAGLLKLLHPDRTPDSVSHDDLVPLLEIAVEMRKRVTDQLAKILPGEFNGVDYVYSLKGPAKGLSSVGIGGGR
jgi:ATP-dependent Lon protease